MDLIKIKNLNIMALNKNNIILKGPYINMQLFFCKKAPIYSTYIVAYNF